MMKTLKTFVLALVAAAVLGTTGLYAQSRAVANVPFDFTVQTVTMPAGEYELNALSNTQGAIQIRNLESGTSVLVLAPNSLSTYQGKEAASGMVIFHRYGNRYFFSEVWTPNGLRGRATPSKLEQEVKASSAEKQVASVTISPSAAQ